MTRFNSETSKGYLDAISENYTILLMTIRRATLDEFWSREKGMVKGNLKMTKRLGTVAGDELGLETWLPPMVPYPLVDEVGMGLACTILRLSLRKKRHAKQLQGYYTRKGKMAWANLYTAGSLGMGEIIYSRDGRILKAK